MAAAGERLLHRCIAQVETFPERVQAMRVEPGSRLAETDWWTEDIYPLSEQVKHLVVSAHEHLRFLVEYVQTTGYVPTMGATRWRDRRLSRRRWGCGSFTGAR